MRTKIYGPGKSDSTLQAVLEDVDLRVGDEVMYADMSYAYPHAEMPILRGIVAERIVDIGRSEEILIYLRQKRDEDWGPLKDAPSECEHGIAGKKCATLKECKQRIANDNCKWAFESAAKMVREVQHRQKKMAPKIELNKLAMELEAKAAAK